MRFGDAMSLAEKVEGYVRELMEQDTESDLEMTERLRGQDRKGPYTTFLLAEQEYQRARVVEEAREAGWIAAREMLGRATLSRDNALRELGEALRQGVENGG